NMDARLLKGAGLIAGIGGMGILFLYLIFSDIIKADFIPLLNPTHAFIVISGIVSLTFFGTVITIFVWFINQTSRDVALRVCFFLLLLICILSFLLSVIYFVRNETRKGEAASVSPLRQGYELFEAQRYGEAEAKFDEVRTRPEVAADAWYWKARVALA